MHVVQVAQGPWSTLKVVGLRLENIRLVWEKVAGLRFENIRD